MYARTVGAENRNAIACSLDANDALRKTKTPPSRKLFFVEHEQQDMN